MNANFLQQLGGLAGLGRGGAPQDGPVVDTAETVHISSLALLKMLKHGTIFWQIPVYEIETRLVYPLKAKADTVEGPETPYKQT